MHCGTAISLCFGSQKLLHEIMRSTFALSAEELRPIVFNAFGFLIPACVLFLDEFFDHI